MINKIIMILSHAKFGYMYNTSLTQTIPWSYDTHMWKIYHGDEHDRIIKRLPGLTKDLGYFTER